MAIVKNKKAYFDYEILEKYTAGLVLIGPEVKSIRKNAVNLKGNFVMPRKGELFVEGMHISPYKQAHRHDISPTRSRKLLLNKKEITAIERALNEKGVTAVVLELYWAKALVKATIGIVRGKKLHDKRETMKQRDIDRTLKKRVKSFLS